MEGDTMRWLGNVPAQVGKPPTGPDLAALRDYTSPMTHEALNQALRQDAGAAAPAVQQQAENLSSALAKIPPYSGEVYRGVSLSDAELAAASRRYLPGNVITEHAFTSATMDRGLSFPGRLRFEIISKTGRPIADYSLAAMEQEIVFDQGTQFQVVEARLAGGTLHVRLQEL